MPKEKILPGALFIQLKQADLLGKTLIEEDKKSDKEPGAVFKQLKSKRKGGSVKKASLGLLIGFGADKALKSSEGARSLTKNLGIGGNLLGSYYDKKANSKDKTTGAKETTQVVAKRKGGKVKKLVYGGVANPAVDQTQSYSSFAQQAPVMEAPAMDVGMSDPMSGYKDGGSVNIGKGKDYIKDLL